MQYKEAFQKKYEQLTNFNDYWKAINNPPERKSIRTNTLLTTPQQLRQTLEQQGYTLEPLPWCKEGFYIGKGPEALGNLQEHKKGYYYIQASTSMIPPIILNPQPGEVVLDCCAAPGGKTTHLAQLMNNEGVIIANEADSKRITIMIDNLQRLHIKNTVITNHSAEKLPGSYDKILLDTPCSASGTIHGNTKESKKTLLAWNQNTVNRLAKLQRKLISHAYQLLKPEGRLVYSTCTLEPEEDEQIIQHLLEHEPTAKLEKIELRIKADWNNGIKIWPHYNQTEGFFISSITKKA
ncbi:MAG TPA: RsmB/NOP family class I SAM-dependent RNA methyltransferase [Candidatus Nanoarchaeia archaeon]|nr:RsmB/NOP family class I SAM-dependent RNA methyltransferase [Candidatus Nanoarchaeia archaeon]